MKQQKELALGIGLVLLGGITIGVTIMKYVNNRSLIKRNTKAIVRLKSELENLFNEAIVMSKDEEQKIFWWDMKDMLEKN